MDAFAQLSRTRTRLRLNEQVSAWTGAVNGLPAVYARLRRVAVLNGDALNVIRQQDGRGTLFYVYPPYAVETRVAAVVSAHELAPARHDLLDLIRKCREKVMHSGYPSAMYDQRLADWTRHGFDATVATGYGG
jgi:DNA adenine methylase